MYRMNAMRWLSRLSRDSQADGKGAPPPFPAPRISIYALTSVVLP
jgi:hypothetical protein